jgi:hypothetical protein
MVFLKAYHSFREKEEREKKESGVDVPLVGTLWPGTPAVVVEQERKRERELTPRIFQLCR